MGTTTTYSVKPDDASIASKRSRLAQLQESLRWLDASGAAEYNEKELAEYKNTIQKEINKLNKELNAAGTASGTDSSVDVPTYTAPESVSVHTPDTPEHTPIIHEGGPTAEPTPEDNYLDLDPSGKQKTSVNMEKATKDMQRTAQKKVDQATDRWSTALGNVNDARLLQRGAIGADKKDKDGNVVRPKGVFKKERDALRGKDPLGVNKYINQGTTNLSKIYNQGTTNLSKLLNQGTIDISGITGKGKLSTAAAKAQDLARERTNAVSNGVGVTDSRLMDLVGNGRNNAVVGMTSGWTFKPEFIQAMKDYHNGVDNTGTQLINEIGTAVSEKPEEQRTAVEQEFLKYLHDPSYTKARQTLSEQGKADVAAIQEQNKAIGAQNRANNTDTLAAIKKFNAAVRAANRLAYADLIEQNDAIREQNKVNNADLIAAIKKQNKAIRAQNREDFADLIAENKTLKQQELDEFDKTHGVWLSDANPIEGISNLGIQSGTYGTDKEADNGGTFVSIADMKKNLKSARVERDRLYGQMQDAESILRQALGTDREAKITSQFASYKDENGETVTVPVLVARVAHGGAAGKYVFIPKKGPDLDKKGKPILDENGKPILHDYLYAYKGASGNGQDKDKVIGGNIRPDYENNFMTDFSNGYVGRYMYGEGSEGQLGSHDGKALTLSDAMTNFKYALEGNTSNLDEKRMAQYQAEQRTVSDLEKNVAKRNYNGKTFDEITAIIDNKKANGEKLSNFEKRFNTAAHSSVETVNPDGTTQKVEISDVNRMAHLFKDFLGANVTLDGNKVIFGTVPPGTKVFEFIDNDTLKAMRGVQRAQEVEQHMKMAQEGKNGWKLEKAPAYNDDGTPMLDDNGNPVLVDYAVKELPADNKREFFGKNGLHFTMNWKDMAKLNNQPGMIDPNTGLHTPAWYKAYANQKKHFYAGNEGAVFKNTEEDRQKTRDATNKQLADYTGDKKPVRGKTKTKTKTTKVNPDIVSALTGGLGGW